MWDRNDVMAIRELECTLAKCLEEADDIRHKIEAESATHQDHDRLAELEFKIQDIEAEIDIISTFDEDLDGF